ncbi:MAG TPA: cation:proton antiporter [Planctomycetota bacterium]|nr:cation:proton antiporter [Planctomycetota bacterium]
MHHDVLLIVTLLMLGAATLVWIARRLRLSPIIAYLILGVIAGTYRQTLFTGEEGAQTLAELGVVLLMFFIGLEFHLDQIRSMLKVCLGGGALQVVITSLAAGLIAHAAGAAPITAAIIGVMIAFSSTALVMKVFEDRKESDSHRARVFLAVGLLQDLAAIVAVVLLPLVASFAETGQSSGKVSPLNTAGRLGVLFVLLPILFFAARSLLPRIFSHAAQAREPEVFTLISLSASLCVGFAAYVAGASLPLGAFLGGLVLSRTPFTSQIMAELNTVRNLSLGFFFVTIGALVDLRYVIGNLPLVLGGVLLVLILKSVLGFIALIAVRTPATIAAGVALPLAEVGEFSFVLGQQASHAGLLSAGEYRYVLAVAVLSLLPAPFLTGASGRFGVWANDTLASLLGPRAAAWLNPAFEVPKAPHAPALSASTLDAMAKRPKAVVVGYGPVGRTLTRILGDFGIHPTVIDMNIDTVKKLQGIGISAVYGDAGRREILQAAGIEKAAYLLVTLPDLTGRIPVIATAKIMNPDIKVVARARYLAERAMLEDAGATNVAYEEAEVAVALAEFLLREIGAAEEDIEKEAARIRAEISLRTGFSSILPAARMPKKNA